MKDIGSIFPLFDEDLEYLQTQEIVESRRVYYSLCREALYSIAKSLDSSGRVVMLPAYTCDTVVTPFKELGWTCVYYPVDLHLRIDVQRSLELFEQRQANLIVVHPYYGRDLNDDEILFVETLHERGCKVVVDLTQCIFSSQKLQFVDYYVGSYRKWFAIPDGGYLEAKEDEESYSAELTENEEFVNLQRDSMYLRGQYYETNNEEIKNISRRLNKMAVEMTDNNITPHRISAISYALLEKEDKVRNQEIRFANYKILLDKLKGVRGVQIFCDNINEINSAPLYFMIYVPDRSDLQRDLIEHHIYAPVIWPVVYDEVLINGTMKYVYDHLLAIPIDQRYDEKDMEKISEVIKKHYNG